MPKTYQKLIWKGKNKKEKYHNYVRDILICFGSQDPQKISADFLRRKIYESSYKKDIHAG